MTKTIIITLSYRLPDWLDPEFEVRGYKVKIEELAQDINREAEKIFKCAVSYQIIQPEKTSISMFDIYLEGKIFDCDDDTENIELIRATSENLMCASTYTTQTIGYVWYTVSVPLQICRGNIPDR